MQLVNSTQFKGQRLWWSGSASVPHRGYIHISESTTNGLVHMYKFLSDIFGYPDVIFFREGFACFSKTMPEFILHVSQLLLLLNLQSRPDLKIKLYQQLMQPKAQVAEQLKFCCLSRQTGKAFFKAFLKIQKAVTLVPRPPRSVDFGPSWYSTTDTFYASGLK